MADTGKQSPLGMNVLGGILQNRCLLINPNAQFFMGVSKSNSQYTYGELVEGTVLRMLTWAINDGFTRGAISDSTYNNLISISGNDNECPTLGNSKPPTYIAVDPSGSWAGITEGSVDCKAVEFGVSQGVAASRPGPANAGYSVTSDTDYGQQATWLPYDTTNANKSITQWGWIRCHALQAHNEFNWHAKEGLEGADLDSTPSPRYEDFLGSFNEAASFAQYTNQTVATASNADTFMEGTFSNMNDLITGDVTGVSLSTNDLAYDLQSLEKIFDFRKLDRFGFPSTLLRQLYENGGLTQDLNLTLGSAGLTGQEIRNLSTGKLEANETQERKIYTAFLAISGENLLNCVIALTSNQWMYRRVTTITDDQAINTLADLLEVKVLFYNSWQTLTVPIYNNQLGLPTGSKTYYLIYNEDGSVNGAINTTNVKEIVGTLITEGAPIPVTGEARNEPSTELPTGLDSYLGGSNIVIPAQIGLAAAALRYAFLQVSNIEQLTPGELGNCLRFLEIINENGDGADGTEASSDGLQKPISQTLVDEVQTQMGLGSSYAGSYRMDDFFGNMSGNPYWWKRLYWNLAGGGGYGGSGDTVTQNAEVSQLAAIYQQLFLAVSWEQATVTPIYTGTGPYTVTGWTVNGGGGYGRGGAPDPAITFSDGLVGTATIGRSDKDTGSNSTGTFGRVISITGGTGTTANIPTATLETPPIGTYGWLPATGGTNSPNGTAYDYNTVTQYYIDAANAEITTLSNNDPVWIQDMKLTWEIMGKQMKVEQRSRYNALGRVEVPRDPFVYTQQDLVSFVDSMPEYSDAGSDTYVGTRSTLELIVDRRCDVGQNIVAQLRQEHNENVLKNCGVPLNNNIDDKIPETILQTLLANGTVPGAREGIEINDKVWVNPEFPVIDGIDGHEFTPPGGKFVAPWFVPITGSKPGDWSPIINDEPVPQIGEAVSAGPTDTIIALPSQTLNSIALLSQTLSADDSAGGGGSAGRGGPDNDSGGRPGAPRLPWVAPFSTSDAIESVIRCNCDCWDLIG
tara:strand:- start:1205 stop:4279 length:3075 start_codon:yes stop_codon:yes gene_type:complete